MKVAFRVDSSHEIGGGHLMRCLTLAKAIRESGRQVAFVTRDLPGAGIDAIEANGISALVLPAPQGTVSQAQDVAETLSVLDDAGFAPDLVMVDSYALDARWERSVGARIRTVAVIDDTADRPHQCALLLDQNLHENPATRYVGLVPKQCQMLLGPRWALLRDEFTRLMPVAVRTGDVRRVLVSYGGSDPTRETEKALRALSALPEVEHVDVIVGAAFSDKVQLEDIAALDPRVCLHGQPSNIADLMSLADVSLGAGGSTSWERCAMALPAIVTAVAQNQVEVAHVMAARGAILYLGDAGSAGTNQIQAALLRLIGDKEAVQAMSAAAASVLGHNYVGAAGVVAALLEVVENGKT